VWAWLVSDGAQLMLSNAREPAGVEAVPLEYPFWSPEGKFTVIDSDGYVLVVSHT
jgi:hypothetical protein